VLKSPWHVENRGYPKLFHTIQPEVRERPSPSGSQVIRLTRSIECLDYSEEFALHDLPQSITLNIEKASWVDWDQQGRLILARDGKIFRGIVNDDGRFAEEQLVDLNPAKPMSLPPPHWAAKW
jgi:hypothetical protein